MSVQVLEREFPTDHLPLLRWLMFTGVCAFGFVMLWYYGLFHLMLSSDKTYISSIILVLYAATCVHCFVRTARDTRARSRPGAHRVLSLVSHGEPHLRVGGGERTMVAPDAHRSCPRGHITSHIPQHHPPRRPRPAGAAASTRRCCCAASPMRCGDPISSDRLRQRFADETRPCWSTIIPGFILMLAPIAGLDAADHASMKLSMGLMSDGMAESPCTGYHASPASASARSWCRRSSTTCFRRGDRQAVRATPPT